MSRVEVLCVSMQQKDLSLIEKLGVKTDTIITNQSNDEFYIEQKFEWGRVRMITTRTIGIGKNRNISLLYAEDEILLLSDDDMQYTNNYEEKITREFDRHQNADVIIFNIGCTSKDRPQKQNHITQKCKFYTRMPYGSPRIAFRKSSWEKSNIWFTTLFGGGTRYTNGEDSIFLKDLQRARLKIYISCENIGYINMDKSTWFKGVNEEYFFNKGAVTAALKRKFIFVWNLYYSLRSKSKLPIIIRFAYFRQGIKAFKTGISYNLHSFI